MTGSLFYFVPAAAALIGAAYRPEIAAKIALISIGTVFLVLGLRTALPALVRAMRTLGRMRYGFLTLGRIVSCRLCMGWQAGGDALLRLPVGDAVAGEVDAPFLAQWLVMGVSVVAVMLLYLHFYRRQMVKAVEPYMEWRRLAQPGTDDVYDEDAMRLVESAIFPTVSIPRAWSGCSFIPCDTRRSSSLPVCLKQCAWTREVSGNPCRPSVPQSRLL